MKSAKKSVRFAEVLCQPEPESYLAGHTGNMLFYPVPPQHNKATGTLVDTTAMNPLMSERPVM